jgi:hypothetical protein
MSRVRLTVGEEPINGSYYSMVVLFELRDVYFATTSVQEEPRPNPDVPRRRNMSEAEIQTRLACFRRRRQALTGANLCMCIVRAFECAWRGM